MNMLPPRYEEGNPKYNQWVKVGVGLLQKGDVLRNSNLRPFAPARRALSFGGCEALARRALSFGGYALNQLS